MKWERKGRTPGKERKGRIAFVNVLVQMGFRKVIGDIISFEEGSWSLLIWLCPLSFLLMGEYIPHMIVSAAGNVRWSPTGKSEPALGPRSVFLVLFTPTTLSSRQQDQRRYVATSTSSYSFLLLHVNTPRSLLHLCLLSGLYEPMNSPVVHHPLLIVIFS